MKEFDVIVIGGGMIGLAFTLALSRKKNFKIAIIDPNECNPEISSSFHTRVSAITPSSKDFLSSINVWDDINRKQGFVSTRVWDQNSHGHLNFYAKDEDEVQRLLGETLDSIKKCAPAANAMTKKLMLKAAEHEAESLIEDAAKAFSAAVQGKEGTAGTMAFVQKKPAPWA